MRQENINNENEHDVNENAMRRSQGTTSKKERMNDKRVYCKKEKLIKKTFYLQG